MDFLESPDSIFLSDDGFSSLLQDCGDFDMNFPKCDSTDILSTIASIAQVTPEVPRQLSDHDYASTQKITMSDSSENLSDSGVSSSPSNSRSPGSSYGVDSSPSDMFDVAMSSAPSGDQPEFPPFLEDLQFDFTDADLEKLASSFPVDTDDILNSCYSGDSPKSNDESTCIDLDDALETCDDLNRDSTSKNQISINIADLTSAVGCSAALNISSQLKGRSGVRCTLPNFKPLVLTEEEKKLLELEKVNLPTDLPLTKSEERVLKRVRRKIRNKKSAMESRKRRKEYLGGLESRVSQCTNLNSQLVNKVKELESQNQTLMNQLKNLQDIVRSSSGISSKTTQATTCIMILLLSFGLFLAPNYGPLSMSQEEFQTEPEVQVPAALATTHKSRRVLSEETIEQPIVKRPRLDSFVSVKQDLDLTGMDGNEMNPHVAVSVKQEVVRPDGYPVQETSGTMESQWSMHNNMSDGKSVESSLSKMQNISRSSSDAKYAEQGSRPSPNHNIGIPGAQLQHAPGTQEKMLVDNMYEKEVVVPKHSFSEQDINTPKVVHTSRLDEI